MHNEINVFSEIAPLKTVLLHRPGKELLNLTPDTLQQLLFDDIPFLKVAAAEHDVFAQILKDNGTEVLYLEDQLVATGAYLGELLFALAIAVLQHAEADAHMRQQAEHADSIRKVGIADIVAVLAFLEIGELSRDGYVKQHRQGIDGRI